MVHIYCFDNKYVSYQMLLTIMCLCKCWNVTIVIFFHMGYCGGTILWNIIKYIKKKNETFFVWRQFMVWSKHALHKYLQLKLIYCYHSIPIEFRCKMLQCIFMKNIFFFWNISELFASWTLPFIAYCNALWPIFWHVINEMQVY